MNVKFCKKCHAQIMKNAKKCPNCGTNQGMPGWAKALIIVAIILCCVIGCVSSCSKAFDEAVKDVFGGYDDQNGKTSFKKGEIFESKYLKIYYDDYNLDFKDYSKYSDLKTGYKIVQFKFTAENIGEDNQTFDYTDFDCYADETAMKQFYGAEDSGLDGGGTISSGKRVSASVYCEVPKDAKKVSVEFKPILADKNYEFVAE